MGIVTSNLIGAIAEIIHWIISAYSLILIVAVILSWVRPDPYNPVVRTIYQLTDPLLRYVRRIMPRFLFASGLDFSPIILLIVLRLLDRVIVQSLLELAIRSREI